MISLMGRQRQSDDSLRAAAAVHARQTRPSTCLIGRTQDVEQTARMLWGPHRHPSNARNSYGNHCDPSTALTGPGLETAAADPTGRARPGCGGHTRWMDGRIVDPRAQALADYLRERAAAFSLSADSTGEQHIADAGMALLDAASLAERLPATDRRLEALSRAGCFEAMRGGTTRFAETSDLRAVVQRPLAGTPMSGEQILDLLADLAHGE